MSARSPVTTTACRWAAAWATAASTTSRVAARPMSSPTARALCSVRPVIWQPRRHPAASQHPRVMIGHHHGLLIAGQVTPDDRVRRRHQRPEPGQRALRL